MVSLNLFFTLHLKTAHVHTSFKIIILLSILNLCNNPAIGLISNKQLPYNLIMTDFHRTTACVCDEIFYILLQNFIYLPKTVTTLFKDETCIYHFGGILHIHSGTIGNQQVIFYCYSKPKNLFSTNKISCYFDQSERSI